MVFNCSNGIYRGIVVAFAGLILIGTGEPPKASAQAKEAAEQREIVQSLRDISATLKSAQEADETAKPCNPKKPNRNSDLCAQWKAADAASSGAEAAWQQYYIAFVALFLGAITMVAAIAAAIYAAKAATQAELSATAASNSHESFVTTERAVIRFYSAEFLRNGGENSFTLRLNVKNFGRSIATKKSMHWHVINAPIFPQRTQYENWKTGILTVSADPQKLGDFAVEASIDDLWNGLFFAMGFVEYEALGRVFKSHFCFRLKFLPKESFRDEFWDCTVGGCQDFPADT